MFRFNNKKKTFPRFLQVEMYVSGRMSHIFIMATHAYVRLHKTYDLLSDIQEDFFIYFYCDTFYSPHSQIMF